MGSLTEVRRAKLLTQEQLAEKAGVSLGTIYAIESGRNLPRLSVIRKLSEALGVEAQDVDEFKASIVKGTRRAKPRTDTDFQPGSESEQQAST